jgi:hypothetical protein
MTATCRAPLVALALIVFLCACAGADDDDDENGQPPEPTPSSREEVAAAIQRVTQGGPAELSFEHDIAPIFTRRCTFCHYPLSPTGLDLTRPFEPGTGVLQRASRWPKAEAKLLIDPADPLNSFLLDKVIRKNLVPSLDGEAMPWQIPPLDAQQIAAIRQWISDGAPDDARFQATIAPIFGDGVSLGARGGSCALCHNPNSLFEPDLTQPFDRAVGIVDVSAGGDRVRVAPGSPDDSGLVLRIEGNPAGGAAMPFYAGPLTETEIDLLVRWVIAGAPQN